MLPFVVLCYCHTSWHYWCNIGKEAGRLAREALNKPESVKTDDDRRRQKFRDGSGGTYSDYVLSFCDLFM
jgi:hypothetical protein